MTTKKALSSEDSAGDIAWPRTKSFFPASFTRMRDRFAAAFLRVAEFFEAHPVLSFSLIVILFVPDVLGRSLVKPLWHDELFTYYISQSPSLSVLLRDTWTVDLNPPLSYVLTKISFLLFGVNTLSTRLPEMAGFLLAMLSLFLFVRRRAGTLYGLVAAVMFYGGSARVLDVEARPYGLLLGFTALSLLAWQKTRAKDRLGIPLLLLAGFCILLSHVFSVFVWTALAAAEVICILRRRRIDWPLAIAWTVPLLCLVTYIPLLRSHGASIFPHDFQPNISSIMEFYVHSAARQAVFLIVAGLGLVVLTGHHHPRPDSEWLLTPPESLSTVFLFAAPLLLIFDLMRSHAAFFDRYGTFESVAVSVIAAVLLAWWTRRDLSAALLCIVVAVLLSNQLPFAVNALLHQHVLTTTEPASSTCEA
ncbi:MAG: glycosyltransferase family 39 protein, partial [Bryocella sp.]